MPVTSQDKPQISVVIVNTNELHRLRTLLPTLIHAEGNFEIIISDNGSSDGSIEFIQENYPQIRVVNNGGNLGFAAANNRAADIACGATLVFLNPDTIVEKDAIVNLVKPLRNPEVGVTTSKITLMKQPDLLNTCGNQIHISGITQCRGYGSSAKDFSDEEPVSAVSGAAFAIKKDIYEELGGFDEDFFIYMEDTDLSIRARLMGWRIIFIPDSVVAHDYSLRFGPKKVFLQERNRYLFLLKNFRMRTLIILLPVLFLAELITWTFSLLNDRPNWRNKLDAILWIIQNKKLIGDKRRQSRLTRRIKDRQIVKEMTWWINLSQVTENRLLLLLGKAANGAFGLFYLLTLCIIWW